MQVNLKSGIDKLLFGMKQNDVISIYGKPNSNYKDEDQNVIFAYNAQKMRLTFYIEEGFKLGYIVASSQDLEIMGVPVIGKKSNEAKKELGEKGILKFTQEEFDTFENFFYEDHWLTLHTEFDEVVKVELGAIINDNDEFDWKFTAK